MKLKNYPGKVDRKGDLRIPSECLKPLGFYPGEDVEIKATGKGLLIEPVKEENGSKVDRHSSVSDQLYGALIADPEAAEKVLSDDYPFNPEDV